MEMVRLAKELFILQWGKEAVRITLYTKSLLPSPYQRK